MTMVLGLSPINTVQAQEHTLDNAHNDSSNFNEDENEKFKEELKTKNSDKWIKSLTPNEALALKVFKEYALNIVIRGVEGNIDSIKSTNITVNHDNNKIKLNADGLKKTILTLDHAIKKSDVIEEDIHVYKYLDEDVNFTLDSLYEKSDNKKIDREKYQIIAKNFKYGIFGEYLDAHLTKPKPLYYVKQPAILLDLKLSKGEHLGYLDHDGHILLPRNQGIVINNSKIIVQDGREMIKVEAELVDKKKVDNKIQAKVKIINDNFRKALEKGASILRENEIPVETKLFQIKTNNLNTSFVLNRAEFLSHVLVQNIPSNLLIKTLEQMKPNVPITITDYTWENIENELGLEHFLDNDLGTLVGYYTPKHKQLILNIYTQKYELNPFREIKENEKIPFTDGVTILHEFGHAVDHLVLNNISVTSEFQKLYKAEVNNIMFDNYMKTNSSEFFASTLSYIFSPNPQYQMLIKAQAPQTVAFIQNELKKKGLLKAES